MSVNNTTRKLLRDCFVDPSPLHLNHHLHNALEAGNQFEKQHPIPLHWVLFTERAIKYDVSTYKLYCLLMWLDFHPPFASYFRANDDAEQFDRFMVVLTAETSRLIDGWKPDGTLFDKDGKDSLNLRSIGFFVDRLRRHYMFEEPIRTMVLQSSNASVHMAQSLAAPPPHGSTAI